MVRVRLGGTLKSMAGGLTEFEVEASNVREVLAGLAVACPRLKPVLDEGVTVAIDGELYRNAWFQPVTAASEVYILPRMAGG
jgi:molybdopterin converting factor small subunit